ncbi:MAG: chemotaxis protein CheB [Pedobacter sp.]|nr:MAG: chemotaxis protein CheB [Pedobacter sp.]
MKPCSALFIGGSAGSLEVLLKILPNLKANLTFPIILILHRKQGADYLLGDLLRTKTLLTVQEIEEKNKIEVGNIYIAPTDYHLLIERDRSFSLDYSEKVNYSRPSIDVTFASAAEIYKNKLVCLLLSGSNADGVNGLKIVKKFNGHTLAQNPEEASVAYMPKTAIEQNTIDIVLNVSDIANYINQLNPQNG